MFADGDDGAVGLPGEDDSLSLVEGFNGSILLDMGLYVVCEYRSLPCHTNERVMALAAEDSPSPTHPLIPRRLVVCPHSEDRRTAVKNEGRAGIESIEVDLSVHQGARLDDSLGGCGYFFVTQIHRMKPISQ